MATSWEDLILFSLGIRNQEETIWKNTFTKLQILSMGKVTLDKPIIINVALQNIELKIMEDLRNTKLSHSDIAKKYGVGRSTVTAINRGQNFKQSNVEYPIRK